MARTTNRIVGRKSGQLLQGVLGALYGTSTAEENPDFLNPGGHDYTDASFDANTVQPYKTGGGAFGGLKAKQANADYFGDILAGNDQLERQKKLLKFSSELQNQEAEANLAKEGEAAFDVYGRLPATSQTLGPVGSLPPFNADIARLFASAGGDVLKRGGVAGLGPYVSEQNIAGKVLANPLAEESALNQTVMKGLISLGGGNWLNPTTGEVTYAPSYIPRQELIETETGKFGFDAEGNQVPLKQSKLITSQEFKPATRGKLQNMVSPEEVAEAKAATGGAGTSGYKSPLDLDMILSGRGVNPSAGLPTASKETISQPERELPANSGVAPTGRTSTSYEGLIPATGRFLGNAAQAQIDLLPKQISPTLKSLQAPDVLTNIPNALGNVRKTLIRKPGETKAPVQDPLSLYLNTLQEGLQLGGDIVRGGIETVADPVRELLQGLASYITPEDSGAPLQEPKQRLQQRLQKRAFNVTGNGQPPYTPYIPEVDPLTIKGYRKKLKF